MAFQRLLGDFHHLAHAHRQETLSGRRDADVVAANLDLGDRIDVDRHTGNGVILVGNDVNGHQFEAEHFIALDDRPNDAAAAFDDARHLVALGIALTETTENDERLVRPGFAVAGSEDQQHREKQPATHNHDPCPCGYAGELSDHFICSHGESPFLRKFLIGVCSDR